MSELALLPTGPAAEPGREAVDELFWRVEILQALYWMRGEGLAEEVGATELAAFLVAEPGVVCAQLERLAAGGYLAPGDRVRDRYRLTPLGLSEGARSFQDEFGVLTRPGHGECGPGCWCQDPRHAADACPNRPEAHHDA